MTTPRVSVTEVVGRLLDGLVPLAAVPFPVATAGGLVVATDVAAPTPLPPEDRAAMDGVAVRAADVVRADPARPVSLRLDGASLAGRGDDRPLAPGTAREIATGAPLPPGADAIVRLEEVGHADAGVVVSRAVEPGRDVRPAGDDAPAGAVLVARGRLLDTGAIGGLAGAGIVKVEVVPAPRVAVLPTGDEVVAGTTPDAVGPVLAHLLGADHAVVHVAAPVADDPTAIRDRVHVLAEDHDLVVTVGGVSVGPRDHAADLVAGLPVGESLSLALRPGRPFAWGRTRAGVPVVCLPGSPVAALAASVLLVRPVVARLAGRATPRPVTIPLGAPAAGDERRRTILPATLDERTVRPVAGQGSADLARLAATSALVDLPVGTERLDAGTDVDVWVLP